ncbi:MAG: S49 family peptidase [Mangrovicoccus sp.]|nr:S49 family peptidase [Mangrovicoccus sp.]
MRRWIPFLKTPPTVSVIRLSGIITGANRSGGLNDAGLAPLMERAFKRGKPKAVALVINSPGGSPVQSSLIGARIRRLAEEHQVLVHAFVEDVAASGGYWLAASADDIWVDASSVVGSIGVISSGFGAHDFIARHGVERRVHTAGRSKSMLDPFRPEKAEDVTRLQGLLGDIHTAFIDHVQTRRSGRIDAEADLFTGEVWVGQKAVDLGLADGCGHLVPKLQELYGKDVKLEYYGARKGLLQRLNASVIDSAVMRVEEQALYGRYGL